MISGWLADGKEQMTLLDVENTKITNRCEVLHQLNLSLEEDRKSLMSQVSLLLSQYHDLLTQTLDDKEAPPPFLRQTCQIKYLNTSSTSKA